MTNEAAFVFTVIAVAAALMASNRVRFDIVALLVVMALMLSGVLSIGEALAGFGSSVVALVAGLLVIGEMLARTGVARAVGDWILKKGGSNETRLLILIMVGAALLGSVMSSTAVVAIFIPIVLRIAVETKLNASRMLIPMSYAALISGMLTLIATTPNIVIHEELKESGYSGFGFFSFAPVGAAVLVVTIFYILLIGRRLLSAETEAAPGSVRSRSIDDLWEDFRLDEDYCHLRIDNGSPLAGKTIAETRMESRYQVRILGVLRHLTGGEDRLASPTPGTELRAKDKLLVVGKPEDFDRLIAEQNLTFKPASVRDRQRWLWELGGATVMIHPESRLIDKSLRETEFRSNLDVHVFGLRRTKQAVENFKDVKLRSADSLFVVGPWSKIHQ
ncbi:MAG: SLC13 family permease, partial [Thiotrichales bacterium]